MAEQGLQTRLDIGVPPWAVNICVGDKVVVCNVPDRGALVVLLSKFAARLPVPGERGLMLMWLTDLPDPLPHFGCCSAEGWRVSFSGEIGGRL